MMSSQNSKDKIKQLGRKIRDSIKLIPQKNWYVTVFFFLIVLVAAVWVWWDCVYKPHPSQEVREKVAHNQEDFASLGSKIERVIERLYEKKERFANPPDYSGQRELFKKSETNIESKSPKASPTDKVERTVQ